MSYDILPTIIFTFSFIINSLLAYAFSKDLKKCYERHDAKFYFSLAILCISLLTLLLLVNEIVRWINFPLRGAIKISLLCIAEVVFILFLSVMALYLPEKKEREYKSVCSGFDYESVLKILNEKERKVIEVLISDGEVSQPELLKKTKIPKATLSRTLNVLEQKGLVVRFRQGVVNIIKLSEIFKPERRKK